MHIGGVLRLGVSPVMRGEKLGLAVAGDAGHAHDFAGPRFTANDTSCSASADFAVFARDG